MIFAGFLILLAGLFVCTQNTQTRLGPILVTAAIAIIVVAALR